MKGLIPMKEFRDNSLRKLRFARAAILDFKSLTVGKKGTMREACSLIKAWTSTMASPSVNISEDLRFRAEAIFEITKEEILRDRQARIFEIYAGETSIMRANSACFRFLSSSKALRFLEKIL